MKIDTFLCTISTHTSFEASFVDFFLLFESQNQIFLVHFAMKLIHHIIKGERFVCCVRSAVCGLRSALREAAPPCRATVAPRSDVAGIPLSNGCNASVE